MKWNRGSDTIWAVVIIAVIILAWISQGAKSTSTTNKTKKETSFVPSLDKAVNTPSGGAKKQTSLTKNTTGQSEYYGQITISAGNAKSEFQPYKEYIILSASSKLKKPVNISGWYLTNAKGDRTYQVGTQTMHFSSDTVTIPFGTRLFFPSIQNASFPILLMPGSKAYLSTGSVSYNNGRLPSFQENKCSGYLAKGKNAISLYPQISSGSCPSPKKEPGVNNLEQSCYKLIQSMSSCHTPDYNSTVTVNKVKETGYVDGVANLTQSCKNFLQAHYSYNACVANHQNDPDFYGRNTWRIFLNHNWELWAKTREKITLFDSQGKIVDDLIY